MAVPPNYFITGVWFKDNDRNKGITHVYLHLNTDTGFQAGIKTLESAVIKLLSNNANSVMTLRWEYSTASWKRGAKVEVVSDKSRGDYLRTHKDAALIDNLDNMIKMNGLIQGLG